MKPTRLEAVKNKDTLFRKRESKNESATESAHTDSETETKRGGCLWIHKTLLGSNKSYAKAKVSYLLTK